MSPTRPRPLRPTLAVGRRAPWTVLALVLGLALAHLTVLAPTPLSGGPRSALPGPPPTDRWVPPRPNVDERFATFPVTGPQGEPGLWAVPSAGVPVRFAVEQQVVDRFGLDEVQEAIEVFNGTAGSRFGATIVREVDDGLNRRVRDGTHRIFIDRHSCGERYLARAHLWTRPPEVRHGQAVRYITEVDLGLCDRIEPESLAMVVRHELGHIAGLDHLCNPDEDCHRPGMGEGHACRIMYTGLRACQEVTQGDLDGLVHLHPRLPRAGYGGERMSAAHVARVRFPAARRSLRAVVTPEDAPTAQQLHSAALAGHVGAPHVVVDEDCTAGPDGEALDHVLGVAGTVTAVGELPRACATSLQGPWALELETIPDARALVERVIEEEQQPPSRLIVAPRPTDDGRVPLAAAAAAGSVALDAPLLLLGPDDEIRSVLDVVEAHDSIREVVLVGGLRHIPTPTVSALDAAGLAVRRLPARDAADATAHLLEQPELAGRDPRSVAVIAHDRPQHAVAGVSLAAAEQGLLLPVAEEPDAQALRLLDASFDRGAILGGRLAIAPALQQRLSRALDGETG